MFSENYVSMLIAKFKTAYHGYIESRLTYGITAWGCSSKENIEFSKSRKRFLK